MHSIHNYWTSREKGTEVRTSTAEKCRFVVIDANSGSDAEKFFDVGKRSARLLVPKLKEGHRTLRMERVGSGKETLYIPTEVAANSTPRTR